MRVIIVLSCLVLAYAKPQGYNYNAPSSGISVGSSHSAPAISLSAPSFAPAPQFHSAHHASPAPAVHHGSPAPAVHHASPAPVVHHAAPAPVQHFQSAQAPVQHFQSAPAPAPVQHFQSAPAPVQHFQSAPAPVQHFQSAPAPVQHFQSAPAPVQQSFQPSFQSFAPQQSIVQKHIYVHVPPADQDEVAAVPSFAPVPQHQKHYKIIFIKAPSAAPSYNAQLIQQLAQPQIEEKTLVYVLSKKPEEIPSELLAARQVQPTQPSKPEVYFIKYKAQKEHIASAPIEIPQAPLPLSAAPISSGSAELSLPIQPRKPAAVYGPAN